MAMIFSPYTYLMKKNPMYKYVHSKRHISFLEYNMAMPKNTRTLKFYLSQNDRKEIDEDDQRYGMASV